MPALPPSRTRGLKGGIVSVCASLSAFLPQRVHVHRGGVERGGRGLITSRSFVGGSGRTFLGGTCGDSWKDSSCRTASELWGDSYDSAAVSTGDFIRDFTGVPTRVLGFCRNLAGMRGVIPSFLRGHRGKPFVKKATEQWPTCRGHFLLLF